ncbi:hypothetical protein GQ43DRAFT_428070 [Delitschia confertaspora ATCC 74209]|uniref:Pre-mRNA polyadenylation factor Fip1 domain-containing protein n=1 Tax=Delitschia confertaspora ATCC 74209 TaxID=1513339 RepID=A0A9P4JW60_9PLEO|nr:hypothetical protein GQ43DRAFT_428070 [Delitschia confertaspora ATCC 74209]
MEEEDDDLYGPADNATPSVEKKTDVSHDDDDEKGDEPMDEGLDQDVEFVLDKPQAPSKPAAQPAPESGSKAIKIEQPPQQQTPTKATTTTSMPAAPQQLGTAYPAVRNSNIDVNQDPVYPPVGKPVSQIDIDADLAESTKPWRLPGADQSDYFNYGFDEFTWEMYRQRQANMKATLESQKAETAQFQQMFSGMGPVPGVPPVPPSTSPTTANPGVPPGAPTGPAAQQQGAPGPDMGMGGMPPGGPTPDQMMAYMQHLQSQGVSPENMDFGQFMNAMAGGQQGGPGFGSGFGPGAGGGGGGQFGPGGAGRGGGGRRGGRW